MGEAVTRLPYFIAKGNNMFDTFEENFGKVNYITLPQLKDYLSISSNNQDAKLANTISYASSVVEHYIGQEIVANDYVEIFNGGTSAVFVSRLPLLEVYQVTEFNGKDNQILADPSMTGCISSGLSTAVSFIPTSNAYISTKNKKFGNSSLRVLPNSSISGTTTDALQFEDSDFTIELYIRGDTNSITSSTLVELGKDSSNNIKMKLTPQYGVTVDTIIAGNTSTYLSANTSIEAQNYSKKKWSHVSISRDGDNERLYMHFNGNQVANVAYDKSLNFYGYLALAKDFTGFIDEARISTTCRYTGNFTAPTNRFRPDDSTVVLVHFDGADKATQIIDAHAEPSDFSFARDTGAITKDIGTRNIRRTYRSLSKSYPNMSLAGPPAFLPYPSGVTVRYRAGYEIGNVPIDLQLATMDLVKILYKQEQDKKGFSFEGESSDKFELSSNFPPHIRRVLDMYRIVK